MQWRRNSWCNRRGWRRSASRRAGIDFDYLIEDIPVLMAEPREGIGRVRKIVQDLNDFMRAGAHLEWPWAALPALRPLVRARS